MEDAAQRIARRMLRYYEEHEEEILHKLMSDDLPLYMRLLDHTLLQGSDEDWPDLQTLSPDAAARPPLS